MAPAEATLQIRTEVGRKNSTRHQTLTKLLYLYDAGDTDIAKWTRAIEAEPSLLVTCLETFSTGDDIENWSSNITPEQLQELIIAEATAKPRGQAAIPGRALAARLIAEAIDYPEPQRAYLLAQLVGTSYVARDEMTSDALTYFDRPLTHLYELGDLTRIIAAACQLDEIRAATDIEPSQALSRLFQVDPARSHKLLEVPLLEEDEDPAIDENLETLHNRLLLKRSTRNLCLQLGNTQGLTLLAQQLLGINRLRCFYREGPAYSDGETTLTSEHTLVTASAIQQEILTSDTVSLSVIDEKIRDAMGASGLIAIPTDQQDPQIVMLLGTAGNSLSQLAAGQLAYFQDIATFAVQQQQTDDRPLLEADQVQQLAREIIHEANNPLSTVQNYLKVLSLKLGEESDAIETINTISEELFRVSDIIKRFRDIESVSTSSSEHCDINATLRDLIRLYRNSQPDLTFTESLGDHNPMAAMGRDDLKQVITNLLQNAADACSEGDVIRIESFSDLMLAGTPHAEICITDTGAGIDQGMDIFVAGFSTKPAASIERGQGLSVVKNIIEAAGGQVSYRSRPGNTQFRINIPQFVTDG